MTGATRLAGRVSPIAGEPQRSAWRPEAMRAALRAEGFRPRRDDDLLLLAETLDAPLSQRGSLRSGHVLVADRL